MRLLPRSLALRVGLIAGVLVFLSTVACLLVVEHTTGRRLADEIDSDLVTQGREWDALVAERPMHDRADLLAAAHAWVVQQHEHPLSQLQVVHIPDLGPVTNQPSLERRASHVPGGLCGASPGVERRSLGEGQRAEVLTLVVRSDRPGGAYLGTVQVADSWTPVQAAQARVRGQMLAVGLPFSVGAAALVALSVALLLRPLRRMQLVAAQVSGGDLTARAPVRAGDVEEVRSLATSLDAMLTLLERSFEQERRLVADASHELRTPLAVLRAQTELLRDRVDASAQPDVEALLARLDRTGLLVDDLLTLAVTDRSDLLLTRPTEVADLAEDLERDLPLLGPRRFGVACRARGVIDVDPARLDQVLRNLVANAVRHTSDDGRIDVVLDAVGDRLRITVADDGTGIDPVLLPHVFDRFRSGSDGGSGLGLPIARALVEAHGGTLVLHSRPGEGTRAVVELPGLREASGDRGVRPADG